MTRRLLAALAAVLLAAVGAWVVLTYVRGADARAQAGEELVPVLVMTSGVPSGTPSDDLGDAVSLQEVPARLVADGALTDLSAVSGLATTADLLPGELLQAGRFADASAVRSDGSLPTPDGLVEISATLETQRAAGGALRPGDLVGVTLTNREDTTTGLSALSTFTVLHDVLVTRVSAPADGSDAAAWTVTLAVSAEDASTVVIGLEAQAVWLTLESEQGTSSSTTTSIAISGDTQ